ncbi:NAD(P)H-binding protein [Lactiplantibacillus fabifermentans]|uniref:Saccharopine dehydrogenase related protein n=2 Tax=Lactiplantibacillus fabifermentans TaxID=483011 RepID=A0A0R2NSG2_9LACO|nr:NAD(P)H-binding protein [Lactiplantibacillus fabifermentans]ETY74000.1 oxidoreductase [Lactiplantibacillus fabifermentans T30PCM01]KRO27360.1 saccharopine dehydrogenase related protein [Lactiplantibacillus fabifermentans DSM 21115]
MSKKVLILAANGQIARLVEQRILNESAFKDVELTLFLRQASRLNDLAHQARVTLVDGDITDAQAVDAAIAGQDIVFVAVVGHDTKNRLTNNVIAGMQAHDVQRVLFTNVLGLYNEVPGEFGRWNAEMIGGGMAPARKSDELLAASGLDYTTLRLPWLNDRDEVQYVVTTKTETYNGVSGSRQSIADVVLQLIADPSKYNRDSIGIADPATQGEDRPVY